MIKNKFCYIIALVLAISYTYILSRVLFPNVTEEYQICFIDDKIDVITEKDGLKYNFSDRIDYTKKEYIPLYCARGWSSRENDGVFSDGLKSTLCIDIDTSVDNSYVLEMKYGLAKEIDGTTTISVNDVDIGNYDFNNDRDSVEIIIPQGIISKGYNFIQFKWPGVFVPKEDGSSEDGRQLYMKLKEFTFSKSKENKV